MLRDTVSSPEPAPASTPTKPAAAAARKTAPGPSLGRRLAWPTLLLFIAGVVYLMATADTGPVDPTEISGPQSRASVVTNAAIIVFREGLEAIMILAAITASLIGTNAGKRKPIMGGAAVAFGASIGTWFALQAVLDAASPLGPKLEAITGFIAIVVLLVVMNWFVHNIYWSQWIGRFHRQRRRLVGSESQWVFLGLVALGFTSVYREGFEVVLFLQNLQLQQGTAAVLEGVAIGLAATAFVGLAIFRLQRKLPYKKLLITTAVMLAVVLVVMVGGTAATFVELGWLPSYPTPFEVPAWLGAWFEIYSNWTTIGAQVIATVLVGGSYFLAEEMKNRGPRRRGQEAAARAAEPVAVDHTAAEVEAALETAAILAEPAAPEAR